MNRAETARLLLFCTANDAREPTETDVLAWHDMLAPIPFEKALEAARRHYRQQPDVWLKPGHLWRMCANNTDITRGETTTTIVDDAGNVLCSDCKLMHRPDEPCSVLIADDGMWRKALGMFRRPAELEPAPER
jgi:RimJ/RimL family protein N-acetyltransferase